ncbi:MAG: Na+/H+ antiporter subunit B [Chloroflexi bacterium]|nr:Na+/H+ antiporter subunit B [Chloroflexota bacterium]
MTSLIFRTTTRFIVALLFLFSIFLLLRGHNDAGGGFVGGLVAAIAVILYSWATSTGEARRLLRVDPRFFIGLGILMAMSSGIPALIRGAPFLTGYAAPLAIFNVTALKVSTPLVFDIGVYLTVIGVALTIILSLGEE